MNATLDMLRKQLDEAQASLADATAKLVKLREIKRAVVREYNRVYMKHKMRERRGVTIGDPDELEKAREAYHMHCAAISKRQFTLDRKRRSAETVIKTTKRAIAEVSDG